MFMEDNPDLMNEDAEAEEKPYVYQKPWVVIEEGKEPMPEKATMDIEQPQTLLDGHDFEKRFRFDMMKKDRLENMCQWKQRDIKGKFRSNYSRNIMKSNNNILKISDKTDMEKLELYSDRFPFLKFRKSIMRA